MKNTKIIFGLIVLACAFFVTCGNPIMEKWWDKPADNLPVERSGPVLAAYHTVTFEANGGSPTPASQYIAPGGKISKLQPITRDHNGFGGWYTDRDCSPGNEWDFAKEVTSSFTLYARWVPKADVEITFNMNYQSLPLPLPSILPEPPPQQLLIKDTLVVKPQPIYLDGYGFDGWYTEPECIHRWNFSFVAAESHTLYASWVPVINAYTVTFDADDGSPEPEDQQVAHGYYAVNPLPMSKTGHGFGGWYDTPTFSEPAWDFTADKVMGPLDLYAKWEPYFYTVKFDADGGDPPPKDQLVAHDSYAVNPLPMSKPGNGFGGWYDNPAFSGSPWDFATGVTGDLTLYAKWETIYHQVTFEANGGSPAPIDQNLIDGTRVVEPAPMNREGYGFSGWYDNAAFSGSPWDFATGVTADLTLHAKWEEADYHFVTFIHNNGSPAPIMQYIYEGGRVIEPEPMIRSGHGFGGWYKDDDCTAGEEWDFTNDVMRTEDFILYAKWVTYEYTVEFEAYGGSPPPISQRVLYNTPVTRPAAMTMDGWNFGGWYSDRDFENEWNFDTLVDIDGIILYAKWEALPVIFTVTFEANGGDPAPASQSILSGSKVCEPLPMNLDHNGFGGWYKDSVFTELWDFSEGVTENLSLYAKWETIYHLVTFEANGGLPAPIDQNLIDGTRVVEPMAMSRSGCGFGGWFTDEDFNNEWNFDTPVGRDGITLYAKWVESHILVNFDPKYPPGSSGGNSAIIDVIDPGAKVSIPPFDYLDFGWSFYGWFYSDIPGFNPANAQHRNALKEWDFDWPVALDEEGDLSVTRDGGIKEKLIYSYDPRSEKLTFTLYARWVPNEPHMVWVKKGGFTMGAKGSGTSPERNVRFRTGFYMGMYEVTQKAYEGHKGYEEIMTESLLPGYSVANSTSTGSATPSHFLVGLVDGPVDRVSWYDALVFCNLRTMQENAEKPGLNLEPVYKINGSTNPGDWGTRPTASPSGWDGVIMETTANGYRLPTEAEWEYAARGGDGSPGNFAFAGTNDDPPKDHAWFGGNTVNGNSESKTHTVGTKEPNGLGIYDMSGNLMEWCWDRFSSTYYSGRPNPDYDPTGPGPDSGIIDRVRRGGSWNNAASNLRNVVRNSFPPDNDTWVMGFRVVRGPAEIY